MRVSETGYGCFRWPYCRNVTPRPYNYQEALCGYPVHRPLPPTRRSRSDGDIVPKEAWGKQASLRALLLLSAGGDRTQGASSAYQNREVAVSRPAQAYSQFLKTKKAANTTAKVASTRSKASSTNGMMCAIPFLAPSAERRLRDARRRNPVRNTRGMTLGGGWAPDQARGMVYERSRASSNAHRLRRPQVQRVYLTLSFSLAPTRTSWRSNALREALEGSSMAA